MIKKGAALSRKLAVVLTNRIWREALRKHRVAAGVEHVSVLSQLGLCEAVVDIGANRGQFALAVRRCFPCARIFSFEPLPGPARVYRALFDGDSNALVFECARGPVNGDTTIHISERDDSSSLLPIAEMQNVLFPGTSEAGTETVRVRRLSDELNSEQIAKPALLKLDVQGFELKALEGCDDLLDKFAWVYVECSFVELYEGQAFADAVVGWLRERGFQLAGVYHMSYDSEGRAIQADFLFDRRVPPDILMPESKAGAT